MMEMLARGDRKNALTVDVEEYFTVQALDRVVPRDRWPAQPMRVEAQVSRLLDLFDVYQVKGTFFVLGWVAERQKRMVRAIHARGHEIAAHSYWHRLIFEQTPDAFREDLRRVKSVLEDIVGAPVRGYRAPTYSITRASLWAHEILADEGFAYSSSIFPIVHDRYGISDYPRFPQKLSMQGRTIWEFPLTTVRVLGRNLPIAGGGYLRLFPAKAVLAGIEWVNRVEKQPAILYFHPWEIDPAIPKFQRNFVADRRGYLGLGKMEAKIEELLKRFHFARVDAVLGIAA